jgi:hypothetical protein
MFCYKHQKLPFEGGFRGMSIRILIKKKVLLEKTSLPRLPSKGGARFGNNLCFVISINSPPLKGDLGGCQSEF